jgi:hypothetical protein
MMAEGAGTWGTFRQRPQIVEYLSNSPPSAEKGPMPIAGVNKATPAEIQVGRTVKEQQARSKATQDEKARRRAAREGNGAATKGVKNTGKPKRKSTAPAPGEKAPKTRKGGGATTQPEITQAEEVPATTQWGVANMGRPKRKPTAPPPGGQLPKTRKKRERRYSLK